VLLGLLGLDGGPDGDVADLDVVGLLDGESDSPRDGSGGMANAAMPLRICSRTAASSMESVSSVRT
jgi:hypothetical protein